MAGVDPGRSEPAELSEAGRAGDNRRDPLLIDPKLQVSSIQESQGP